MNFFAIYFQKFYISKTKNMKTFYFIFNSNFCLTIPLEAHYFTFATVSWNVYFRIDSTYLS